MKFENKYFLNIIEKTFILIFSYFTSFPNSPSNKKKLFIFGIAGRLVINSSREFGFRTTLI
jgi:hypothetical protein